MEGDCIIIKMFLYMELQGATMAKTVKIIFVILLVAAIAGYLLYGLAPSVIDHDKSGKNAKPTEDSRPQLQIADTNNWPMFRGGQDLSGMAKGSLPDSLTLIWKFKTGGEIKSSPAIDDGLVFVGSSDANVYAVNLRTGQQVWAFKTNDAVEASPCAVGGMIFVGSSDNFLYAIDAKTGQLKWKYQTGAKVLGAANWALSSGRIWILAGSYDNKLHCVDSANGEVVWTYETGSYVNGSPAVGDGKAVFGGCDAKIHVVSVSDGNMVTQIDTGSYIAGSAAVVAGRVYVGNYDNVLICADIAAGRIVWKYAEAESAIFSSPAVGEGVVIFGCRDKRVHCVGRDTGKTAWTFQTLGEVDSSPVICGDKVVVGSEDGRLYMLRLSDGKQVWSYEVGRPIISSPAVAGGVIVVGSDDGFIYAFGPS